MINQLPIIEYKNKTYIFDYKLRELRRRFPLKFICLNDNELELLAFALEQNNKRLINLNLKELEYKL